ncbi:MAG TPA: ankyrin repeat domain-containing protein [Gammaproteobacteria bacterium]|nr:ankyrin repeat domain-containing protein [Gammaproteobacteria bacterium]
MRDSVVGSSNELQNNYGSYFNKKIKSDEVFFKKIESLIKKNQYNVAFCLAAGRGEIATMEQLIKLGATPNARFQGMSALHYAAKYGRVESIAYLVKRCEVDANSQSEIDEVPKPLWLAVRYRHFDAVKALSDKTDLKGLFGDRTVIHEAIHYAPDEILRWLLSKDPSGVNMPLQDKKGSASPLQLLLSRAHKGSAISVHSLVSSGAHWDIKGTVNFPRPLQIAMMRDDIESVRVLLKAKASLESELKKNPGLVNELIRLGCTKVIKMLLENKLINPNPSDTTTSPLYLATYYNHPKLIELFVGAGAIVTPEIAKLAAGKDEAVISALTIKKDSKHPSRPNPQVDPSHFPSFYASSTEDKKSIQQEPKDVIEIEDYQHLDWIMHSNN